MPHARYSPRVIEAAHLLQLGPKALASAAKAWAKMAAQDPRQGSLFGSPPTAAEAWAEFLKVGGVSSAGTKIKGWPPKPTDDLLAQRLWRLRTVNTTTDKAREAAIADLAAFDAKHPDVAAYALFSLAVLERRTLVSRLVQNEDWAARHPDEPRPAQYLKESQEELERFDAANPDVGAVERQRIEKGIAELRRPYKGPEDDPFLVAERVELERHYYESATGSPEGEAAKERADLWDLANPEGRRAYGDHVSRQEQEEEREMGQKMRAGYAKEEAEYAAKEKEEEKPPAAVLELFAKKAPPSDFASQTLVVAKGIPPDARWGSNRIYLRALYDAWPEPKPTWEAWGRELMKARSEGALRLAGGEKAGAMDSEAFEASAVADGEKTHRFLVVDAS